MARQFNRTTPDYAYVNTAAVTDYPLTLSCWFNTGDITNAMALVVVTATSSDGNYWQLMADGSGTGDPVSFRARAGGGSVQAASTTTGYTANQWHHACAVGISATSRDVYIDGGSKGSNTASAAPTGLVRTCIGARASSITSNPMQGRIAEVGIWNVALDAAEIGMLARGFSPLCVRPDSLVSYWPLLGESPWPWIDECGGLTLTAFGGSSNGEHCPIIGPGGPSFRGLPGSMSGGGDLGPGQSAVLLGPYRGDCVALRGAVMLSQPGVLLIEMSHDGGVTWTVGRVLSSTTHAAGTSGFNRIIVAGDVPLPALFRVSVLNTGASGLDYRSMLSVVYQAYRVMV